jgi:flagellar protein FliO/FliZ
MNSLMTLSRAVPRAAIAVLGAAVSACLVALLCAWPAQAFTPSNKAGGESTPLNITPTTGSTHTSAGGASLVRTIVGLLIVLAVIWGLTWILRQVKSGRTRGTPGSGLTSIATLPLGSGRTLHLVRAGSDYLLVGSAEHGVAPIHRYTEEQAREAGLLNPDRQPGEDFTDPTGRGGGGGGRARGGLPQIPGQPHSGTGAGDSGLLERLRDWTVRE